MKDWERHQDPIEHMADPLGLASRRPVVFLVDVDNTLLDNDRVAADLMRHLSARSGRERQQRYWALFEELRQQLGYADYLGALQRYRVEHPRDPHVLTVSLYLFDYPFANRLYPGSLDVIEHLKQWGPVVILPTATSSFSRARSSARGSTTPSMATCSSTSTRSRSSRTSRGAIRPSTTC